MLQSIFAPSHCPSCDSELVWENDLLYCRSITCACAECKGSEHFAKTMKIKGLGPASIRKLGWTCPSEIYLTPRESILASLGSEAVTNKLMSEILNSFDAPLERLLPAFGIPLIGNTATRKCLRLLIIFLKLTQTLVSVPVWPKGNITCWMVEMSCRTFRAPSFMLVLF